MESGLPMSSNLFYNNTNRNSKSESESTIFFKIQIQVKFKGFLFVKALGKIFNLDLSINKTFDKNFNLGGFTIWEVKGSGVS